MKALEAAREARGPVINKNGSAETLDPVTGHIVGEDTPTWGQQQADALALLADTALHHALDPHSAMSPSPPHGSRRRVPGGTAARWRAAVHAAQRPAIPRRPVRGCGAYGPGRDAAGAQRRARTSHRRADLEARLVRQAPRPPLRDQRPAPARPWVDARPQRQSATIAATRPWRANDARCCAKASSPA